MISREHILYNVNDVFNAVFVQSNMLGDSMYYGKGAGKLPTASAVAGDVIDCVRNSGQTKMCFWDSEEVQLISKDESRRRFFVRVKKDFENKIRDIFGDVEIIKLDELKDETGFVTPVMTEKDFEKKLNSLNGVITRIRIEE